MQSHLLCPGLLGGPGCDGCLALGRVAVPLALTLPSLQVVLGPDLPAAGGRDSDEAEPPGSLPDPGERELPRGVLRLCEVSSDPNTWRRVGKDGPSERGGNDRPLEADDRLGVGGEATAGRGLGQ